MLFVEGIGYINESNTVSGSGAVSKSTQDFDGVLRTEEQKLADVSATTTNLDAIFSEAAKTYQVDEKLLKAIAYTESGFQSDVTSSAGAMGIMQLMPGTASAYGVSDPYDAYQNIMGGAAVLRKLLDMFGNNQTLAVAAYNAGCGNVQKYGGVPPFSETQAYVQKVLSLAQTDIAVPSGTVTVSTSSAATAAAMSDAKTIETDDDTARTADEAKRAEILSEIQEIISALASLNTDSSYTDAASNSALSLLSGDTSDSSSSSLTTSNLFGTYGSSVQTLLSALETADTTDTDSLQDVLSYAEYQLLTAHYANMTDIISVLGSTSLATDTDTDDSLSDLFKLATQQNLSRVTAVDLSNISL